MKNIFNKLTLSVFCFIFALIASVAVVGCNEEEAKEVANAVLTTLNTKLATAEETDGKNLTMYDALQDVELNDFSVAEENAKQDNKFVWNATTDRFVIVNSAGEVVEGEKGEATNFDLWLISNEINETFSTYYTGSLKTITTSRGFDVGECYGITQIDYSNTGTEAVTFRTTSNDTTLNINTNGTVNHYGDAGKVSIQKVDSLSYYENGLVRVVEIVRGRVVVNKGAEVTLLVAKTGTSVKNQGKIEAYVGNSNVTYKGTAPTLSTSVSVSNDTVAIIKGNTDRAVTELPETINNATIILLKDYDHDKPQVTISGRTTIYGNMTKLNGNIVGDASNVLLKNVHTTGIKVGTNFGFNGTLEFDGGQLDYDSEHFQNGEDAAFYAKTGYGVYRFKNMTVSTGTKKGIKISKAKEVLIENCVFDAATLSAEAESNGVQSQLEVYNRSLSCVDIQVQNADLGPMDIVIRGCTFANIPQGEEQAGVKDSDSAGAIKIKAEIVNTPSLNFVLIENNNFINCYRDLVVGVNIRITSNSLNFPQKDPTTLKHEQNNVDNTDIYTIRNNTSTHTATTVADRGVLVIDDRRDKNSDPSVLRAYAERLGEIIGGCAVYNTYKSQVITLTTTIEDINELFGL